MSIRDYINIVERQDQPIEEAKVSSHNRQRAAIASLRRLMSTAGAEFAGEWFQLEDAEKLGLRADFDRVKQAGFIHFAANPDWWKPTERGLIAIRSSGQGRHLTQFKPPP